MKKIYLNLKRFDIPRELGGINDMGASPVWAKSIVSATETFRNLDCTVFFPEAHIFPALEAAKKTKIGCQSVHFEDVERGRNFGAFTTFRTAKAMQALGVKAAIIGHCEERKGLQALLDLGGSQGDVNEILNRKIKKAVEAGLEVLYCVGEKSEEQERRFEVLRRQLEFGLKDVDLTRITVAYEPVWAIGVGKTPPGREYTSEIAAFIKRIFPVPVVYGGGLKEENAAMIASIPDLDGGLIALTRFGADFGFYIDDYRRIVQTYKEAINEN